MKRTNIFFATLLISCLLFSCRSFKVIEIETYNPSAITFPPEVKTVMIVNNAAQQPDGIGHKFNSLTEGDSTLSVSADSMAWHFCMSLGKAMVESPIFYDVRICEDTLRQDSLFYNIRPFVAGEVESFCDSYGVDALISLDKLFFNTVFYKTDMSKFIMGNMISVEIAGEIRALWPGQKEVYTIPFADSLTWLMDESSLFSEVVEVLLPSDIRPAMLYLSEYTGQKLHANFVPFWSEDKRWYYTSVSSEWKRGSVFAAAGKWAEAITLWEPLYEKTNKWKSKASLASNLALCYEMAGNFRKAIDYAEISYGLFKEHADEKNYNTNLQSTYLEILKSRAEADQLLSKQLKEQ